MFIVLTAFNSNDVTVICSISYSPWSVLTPVLMRHFDITDVNCEKLRFFACQNKADDNGVSLRKNFAFSLV